MTDAFVLRLRIVAGLLLLFGVAFIAAAPAATSGVLRLFVDLGFWPLDGAQSLNGSARLLAAIGGGVMAGWGAMLWALAGRATLPRALFIGATVWFVLDGVGSILSGGWFNAVLNAGLYVILLWAVAGARTGATR